VKRITELAGLLLTIVLLGGCAGPLLQYQRADGAAALQPIGAPATRDDRARFRAIYCALLARDGYLQDGTECEAYLTRLTDEVAPLTATPALPEHNTGLQLRIVPGALGECFGSDALPYLSATETLRERGYDIDYIHVDGRSGSARNGGLIAAHLAGLELDTDQRLVLLGYSKGASDILHFLADHPEAAQRVDAVVSIAGSINGSPLADRYQGLYDVFAADWPFDECGVGDRRLLPSLQRTASTRQLAAYPPPPHIAYFSLGTFAQKEHIARIMRLIGHPDLSRADPRNDGQTLYYDQMLPGATLLGYANADHWAVAIPMEESMPFLGGNGGRRESYPRRTLFEALLRYLSETIHDACLTPENAGSLSIVYESTAEMG